MFFFVRDNELPQLNSRFNLMQNALLKIYEVLQDDLKGVNSVLQKIYDSEKCFNRTATRRLKFTDRIIDDLERLTLTMKVDTYDDIELNFQVRSIAQSIIVLADVLAEHDCLDVGFSEFVSTRSDEYGESDNIIAFQLQDKAALLMKIVKKEKTVADMKKDIDDMLPYFENLASWYRKQFQLLLDLESALEMPNKIEAFVRPLISTVQGSLDAFCEELVRFYRFAFNTWQVYERNKETTSAIAKSFATSEFRKLEILWKVFRFALENDIIAELMYEITYRGPQHINTIYMDAFRAYEKVIDHLNSEVQEEIISAVASMKIWREPIENLDDTDLILFRLDKEKTQNAMKLPLDVLVDSKAPQQLKRILTRFFTSVSNEINWMTKKYDETYQDFEETFISLNNSLQVVAEKSHIDEDFIV